MCDSSEDDEDEEDEKDVNMSSSTGLVLKQLKTDDKKSKNEDEDDDDDDDDDDAEDEDDDDDEIDVEIEENIFSLQNYYFFVTRILSHNYVAVYIAIDRITKEKVCVKIVIKNDYSKKQPMELKILSMISSISNDTPAKSNLQTILKYFKSSTSYVIVTKLHKESSFRRTLFDNSDDIKSCMKQLLSAVDLLHSIDIISRDIKPSNMLWNNETKKLVLIDFDLSTFQNSTGHTAVLGTDGFIAPEVLLHENKHESRQNDKTKSIATYDKKIDIYSSAIVFASLIFKVRENDVHLETIKGWKKSMTKNKNSLNSAKNLLRKMLNNDAKLRPSAKECLEHEYFKDS